MRNGRRVIGARLVVHWSSIGSGLVFGMEFVDTFLGGSRSFRKRKDAPGTEFVPIFGEKTPFEKSSAKILHFFELCKSLGVFF